RTDPEGPAADGHGRLLAVHRLPDHRRAAASCRLTGSTRRRRDVSGVRLKVRLTPGAGADHIDGVVDGVLRVRVAALPVDGAANEALVRLLAATLRVAARRVVIVRGALSRAKVVEVEGLAREALRSRWPGADV